MQLKYSRDETSATLWTCLGPCYFEEDHRQPEAGNGRCWVECQRLEGQYSQVASVLRLLLPRGYRALSAVPGRGGALHGSLPGSSLVAQRVKGDYFCVGSARKKPGSLTLCVLPRAEQIVLKLFNMQSRDSWPQSRFLRMGFPSWFSLCLSGLNIADQDECHLLMALLLMFWDGTDHSTATTRNRVQVDMGRLIKGMKIQQSSTTPKHISVFYNRITFRFLFITAVCTITRK